MQVDTQGQEQERDREWGSRWLSNSTEDHICWTQLPVDQIDVYSSIFRQAHDYWSRIRGNKWAPARSDFDPAELAAILPNVLLMEVEQPGPRFRYRLAGTRTADFHAIELTGRYVDQLEPAVFAQALGQQLAAVVASRQSQFIHWRLINRAEQIRDYCVLRLPMSSDGKTVDIILTVADYTQVREPLALVSLKAQ